MGDKKRPQESTEQENKMNQAGSVQRVEKTKSSTYGNNTAMVEAETTIKGVMSC